MKQIELFIFILLFIFFLYLLNSKYILETYQNNLNSNLIEVNDKKQSVSKGKGKKKEIQQNYGMVYPYKPQQNIQTTSYPDCLKNGFCNGIFESKIPKDFQEFSVINYSDKTSNQNISNLQQIANRQYNLSIGDKNYQYQPPPNNTTFT